MGLRDQLRWLKREALEGKVVVNLEDGGTRAFDDQLVFKEMFLCQTDLYHGEARPSEVLDAVRAATPESRAAFEAEYGPIEMEAHVIASESDGGWIQEYRLLEDGTVESVRHDGGSEEAARIRREAQQQEPGS